MRTETYRPKGQGLGVLQAFDLWKAANRVIHARNEAAVQALEEEAEKEEEEEADA